MNVIAKFENEYDFLSNFYESDIAFPLPGSEGGITFRSAEAAFQSCKYKAMVSPIQDIKFAYVQKVLEAPTPGLAKKAGRSVSIDTAEWDRIKVDVMREVVWQKFNQSETLRKRLLDTGHAMLVEGNDWGDTFWGRCEGKGYNILGVILMEVRGYWLWKHR